MFVNIIKYFGFFTGSRPEDSPYNLPEPAGKFYGSGEKQGGEACCIKTFAYELQC